MIRPEQQALAAEDCHMGALGDRPQSLQIESPQCHMSALDAVTLPVTARA